MAWEIIDTGTQSAEANMRCDLDLLQTLDQRSHALIHFYEWERGSATYGALLNPAEYLNLEGVQKRSLALAQRPTGGGIVFHIWDLAFSVLVPASHPAFSQNTLENYAFVNRAVLLAAQEFLGGKTLALTPVDLEAPDPFSMRFCMAQPTKYDVVLNGRKIAGAAQRKTKKGFLHQGTIALVMPPQDYLNDVLLPGTQVANAMEMYTYPLLGKAATNDHIQDAKAALRTLLQKHLAEGTI